MYSQASPLELEKSVIIAEGIMIAMLGLWGNSDFYKLLATFGVLSCLSGIHDPEVR